MHQAAHYHVRRGIHSGIMSYNSAYMRRMEPTIFKWELMRLGSKYDAILFSDIDVDLLPSAVDTAMAANEWMVRLPRVFAHARERQPPLHARSGRPTLLLLCLPALCWSRPRPYAVDVAPLGRRRAK